METSSNIADATRRWRQIYKTYGLDRPSVGRLLHSRHHRPSAAAILLRRGEDSRYPWIPPDAPETTGVGGSHSPRNACDLRSLPREASLRLRLAVG